MQSVHRAFQCRSPLTASDQISTRVAYFMFWARAHTRTRPGPLEIGLTEEFLMINNWANYTGEIMMAANWYTGDRMVVPGALFGSKRVLRNWSLEQGGIWFWAECWKCVNFSRIDCRDQTMKRSYFGCLLLGSLHISDPKCAQRRHCQLRWLIEMLHIASFIFVRYSNSIDAKAMKLADWIAIIQSKRKGTILMILGKFISFNWLLVQVYH